MNFPAGKVMPRYGFVAALLVVGFVAVLVKAGYTMTVRKGYWMAVAERYKRANEPLPPTRGNILADNGELLASSLPEYKIFMDFMSWEKDSARLVKDQHRRDSILENSMDSICQGMRRVLSDVDPQQMRAHLMEGRRKKSHNWLLYKKRISYIQYRQLKELPLFRLSPNSGGFHTEEIKTRNNPYGRLAIRTIGDLYKGRGDSARTGLELSFDSILRGKPGFGHRQKVLNRYLTITDKPAENGCDIQTTLNVAMQDVCEKALSDKLNELETEYGGCEFGVCILMEVATGDIKAMTSLSKTADGTFKEISPYAVSLMFEPGSVFKPMSFLVAMNDGYLHIDDAVDVQHGVKEMYGRKMRDANWRSGGNGVLTVPQILQKSSNVGVSTFIDRFYHNDPRRFVKGIYSVGTAEDLQIPLAEYKKPRIRMPAPDKSNWSNTALPWMSIGYETQIPPINTLNFYNGIANNGKLLRPRLVKAVLRDGEVVKEYPVTVLREHMAKPEAVRDIQYCLESVVTQGLGRKAGSRHFRVSGKTGTAQVWTKAGFSSKYLISFAGYFPSDKPEYSCIVCIHRSSPASGGTMCAPVFRRVAETVMAQRRLDDFSGARDTANNHLPLVGAGNMAAAASVLEQLGVKFGGNVLPSEDGRAVWGVSTLGGNALTLMSNGGKTEGEVPDVRGYGLRDALFRLEKLGLRVHVQGRGRVSTQSLKPGYRYRKGEEIDLMLGDPKEWEEELADTVAAKPVLKPDSVKADSAARVHAVQPKPTPKTAEVKKAETEKPAAKKPVQKKEKPAVKAEEKKKPAKDATKPKKKEAVKAENEKAQKQRAASAKKKQ